MTLCHYFKNSLERKLKMRISLFFLLLILSLGGISFGETKDSFLGAPLVPVQKIIKETDARLEMKTNLSHDEAVKFYRDALKHYEDIKFRDWKDSTYIEDDGNLPWHSITIEKGTTEQTTVVIMKDNWSWIIGTLILRYIGVFVVLAILFVGMSVSGKIIEAWARMIERKKQVTT